MNTKDIRPNYTRDEARALGVPQFIGANGVGFDIGDRVRAYGHYYIVTGASITSKDRVHVKADNARGLGYVGPETAFIKA